MEGLLLVNLRSRNPTHPPSHPTTPGGEWAGREQPTPGYGEVAAPIREQLEKLTQAG